MLWSINITDSLFDKNCSECFTRFNLIDTYRVNWGNVVFLDHNIRHVIARDFPNPTGAFHTSTESVDSLVSKFRSFIINALVVRQSESRELDDVLMGQSRTEWRNFGLTWGNVEHCLG